MAGRDTPLMRPMRSSADAIVAPVLPAEIMAEALPSRTASAARTSDESFILRTLEPGSALIADHLGRRDHLEVAGERAEHLGLADQHHRHAELLHGPVRAGDDLLRCLVPTHRVERDGEHVRHLARGYSTSMA